MGEEAYFRLPEHSECAGGYQIQSGEQTRPSLDKLCHTAKLLSAELGEPTKLGLNAGEVHKLPCRNIDMLKEILYRSTLSSKVHEGFWALLQPSAHATPKMPGTSVQTSTAFSSAGPARDLRGTRGARLHQILATPCTRRLIFCLAPKWAESVLKHPAFRRNSSFQAEKTSRAFATWR